MNKIPIAKIGKTYGLKGWQKIHFLTDFPQQFKKGATFHSDKIELTVENIDLKRKLVKFKGFDTPEAAQKLVNRKLYTTEEETRKNIELKENEYFWFDIIGSEIIENGEKLGVVKDIERYNDSDYLIIDTGLEKPKRFLIEFKRNVDSVDLESKKIYTSGAKELLESLL